MRSKRFIAVVKRKGAHTYRKLIYFSIFFLCALGFGYLSDTLLLLDENKLQEGQSTSVVLPSGPDRIREKGRKKGLPVLKLTVSEKAMQKLSSKAVIAKKTKFLITESGDEVRGSLAVNDSEAVDVLVRLKGDDIFGQFTPNNKKWPLRIKTRNKTILGMSKFSLHRNETRHGHGEMLLLNYLRKEGLIAPRYFYVTLIFNGVDNGVMALEEHFTKELLESMGKRESVIMAFDEDPFWRQRRLNHLIGQNIIPSDKRDYGKVLINMHNYPFKVFEENRVWASSTLRTYYREALGLLRGYQMGKLDQDQVFDNEAYAKYVAITHLWNRNHGFLEYNLRFYYNPFTRLFEPVSFDNDYLSGFSFPVFALLKSSPEFHIVYRKALGYLKHQIDSGKFFDTLSKWEAKALPYLRQENANEAGYSKQAFIDRLNFLLSKKINITRNKRWQEKSQIKLRQVPLIFNPFLLVFCVKHKDIAYLEFKNISKKMVRIDKILFASRLKSGSRIVNEIKFPRNNKYIPPHHPNQPLVRIPVPKFPLSEKEQYEVTATLDGANAGRKIVARRAFPPLVKAKYVPLTTDAFLAKFPFVSAVKNENAKLTKLKVNKGNWIIKEDLIVPPGTAFEVSPGTSLSFAHNRKLVLRGPLIAKGTSDAPIKMSVIKNNNFVPLRISKNKSWGGIIVLKAKAKSHLQHVEVSDIGPLSEDDWGLTGAITFYESDVHIKSSKFHNNGSEDVLNIVQSAFYIEKSSFTDATSDAIDVDFGHGVINACSFKRIGGDALDFSGSNVIANKVVISEIADKAISVGENSNFKGFQLNITKAAIGIAAKDSSKASLLESQLSAITKYAFMAYNKKSEYGSASLKVENSTVSDVKEISGAQAPSRIVVNKVLQPHKRINIDELYGKQSPLSRIKPRKMPGNIAVIQNTAFKMQKTAQTLRAKKWNSLAKVFFDRAGATIHLEDLYQAKNYELQLSFKNNYRILFFKEEALVDFVTLPAKSQHGSELIRYEGAVPKEAVVRGYDKIVIYSTSYNPETSSGYFALRD